LQIAAVSDLSNAEIGEIVDSAVKESGEEGKAAKKLARHMRAELLKNRPDTGGSRGQNDDDDDPMEGNNTIMTTIIYQKTTFCTVKIKMLAS
jgi:hypothetical protein